ncbi:MAG: hypothetical protein ACR2RE_22105 [Geminicoccaceae bacterium]
MAKLKNSSYTQILKSLENYEKDLAAAKAAGVVDSGGVEHFKQQLDHIEQLIGKWFKSNLHGQSGALKREDFIRGQALQELKSDVVDELVKWESYAEAAQHVPQQMSSGRQRADFSSFPMPGDVSDGQEPPRYSIIFGSGPPLPPGVSPRPPAAAGTRNPSSPRQGVPQPSRR